MLLKKNSLKTKIWLYLAIFSFAILVFLWLFQIVSLNSYYEWYKTKEINTISSKIVNSYKEENDFYDSLAYQHGICIEIMDKEKSLYVSNMFNKGCLIGDSREPLLTYKKDFIESKKDRINYKIINPRFSNKTLVSAIRLKEGLYVFVNASLEPLDSSITILKNQFIYVSLLVLALAFLIGYFISRRISSPMEKIGAAAKKMAKGDYDVVFDPGTNITELQELSKTLAYTRDELAKTDELRRELLANVGHDLKTPLTMIRAYAEMVRDLSFDHKEKREEHLNIIMEETERLNLLVEDILDLSKMQSSILSLTYNDFDLDDLIQQILKRYTILKETEKYVFIYKNKKKILVHADIKRMEQVLYNLINNAINYTGKNNRIYIELEDRKDKIRVSIRDTGKGISKEKEKYIWDTYYHSEKKHKRNAIGTGLGLSIVKNILEMHRFSYGVQTSKTGTIFYFDIQKSDL